MCKRYFFILFVLKICTFRFANYTFLLIFEKNPHYLLLFKELFDLSL